MKELKTIEPIQCKACRAFLEWSQDDLAKKSDVSKATIADFERGVRIPHKRILKDIKRMFIEAGIDFDENEKAVLTILKSPKPLI